MAEPQTENGFVMIALDLFASIMVADLPNRCMIVLSYHLVHSYGPAKRRDVFLDPAAIEDYTNLHRNNARRAIKELCDANILEKQPGGIYRFNKDYESWTPGGLAFGKKLNGGTMEFAAWTLNAFGKRIKKSKHEAIQPDSPPIPLDSVTDVEPNPAGLQTECLTQSSGIATIADPTNTDVISTGDAPSTCGESLAYACACPHKSVRSETRDSRQQQFAGEEVAEGISFPIEESSPWTEAVPVRDPVVVPDPEPEAPPIPPLAIATPEPEALPRPVVPRTAAALRAALTSQGAAAPTIVSPDPATVRELEDFALLTLGDRGELEDFHTQVRGWLYSFPAVHIRDAITSTAANAKQITAGKLAAYTLKILREPPRKTATVATERHQPATEGELADLERVYRAAREQAEEDEARRKRRVAR